MQQNSPAARIAGHGAGAIRSAAPRRSRRPPFPRIGPLSCVLLIAGSGLAQPSQLLPAAFPGGEKASLPRAGTAPPATTAELASQFQAKLAEAQADLNRALAAQSDPAKLPPGATSSEAIEYRAALQSLVQTYQLHLNDLAALEAIRQRQQDLDRMVKSWAGFAEPLPYSVFMVDGLRNAVHSLALKIEAGEAERAILETFVAEGRTVMQESDGKLRRLSEALESAGDQTAITRLTWQHLLERTRGRAAAASAAYYEERRRTNGEELVELRQRLAFTRRQLAMAAQHVSFPQADLDAVLKGLEGEHGQLGREIQTAETELQSRQKALAEARASAERALEGASEPGPARDARLRELRERAELESARVETSAEQVIALRQTANFVNTERTLWQARFVTFEGADLEKIQEDSRRLNRWDRLARAGKPHFAQQIELAADEIAGQQDRIRNLAGAGGDSPFHRELIETYRERERFYRRALDRLGSVERLIRCWKESLDLARQSLPFTARVADLFGEMSSFGTKLWQFELIVVEDTITVDGQPITGRRSVTVGKIVMAILILLVGYWIASLLARLLERIAVRRLKADRNQANLIGRWARVVLVFALIIFSLVSVKIPLTVLAFAGGALAIGLGFGTQNLLKNFMSGIIILFERPFRVGDVLDVNGQRGVVTSVGLRSSIIHRWDNTEILIPNSALLENNVTNWTLTDRSVRFTVAVGVAYGSDTRRVTDLLAEAAHRHGLVEKDPKPQVFFTEFGDNALLFELRYWVDVLRHNAAQIGSDLRHMIASMFAENGIEIAFPQRDIHLAADRPIAVQLAPHELPGDPKPAAEA